MRLNPRSSLSSRYRISLNRMSQRTCSAGSWLRSQTISTGAGIMASTTIFLWRAKLCHSYLLGGSRSAPGGSPETEPAAQVVQECADGGYSHERHIGSEYERHGRRVEDYGGRQQPVGPDGA